MSKIVYIAFLLFLFLSSCKKEQEPMQEQLSGGYSIPYVEEKFFCHINQSPFLAEHISSVTYSNGILNFIGISGSDSLRTITFNIPDTTGTGTYDINAFTTYLFHDWQDIWVDSGSCTITSLDTIHETIQGNFHIYGHSNDNDFFEYTIGQFAVRYNQ